MDPVVLNPILQPNDFVIFSPDRVTLLNDPSVPPDRFYLLSVIRDHPSTFDYEILESGPCALVEAIAISACKKGQRVWFPTEPFGHHNP